MNMETCTLLVERRLLELALVDEDTKRELYNTLFAYNLLLAKFATSDDTATNQILTLAKIITSPILPMAITFTSVPISLPTMWIILLLVTVLTKTKQTYLSKSLLF